MTDRQELRRPGFSPQGWFWAGCALLAAQWAPAAETWRVAELDFAAARNYDAGGGDAVVMDVVFTHRETGAKVSRPGFWDGARDFKVRFAPMAPGAWDWRSSSTDVGLSGRTGTVHATAYEGPLALYRHGFVRTEKGRKHFVHADGTPFLYLGDTHWTMYSEEMDEGGPHAGDTGAESHFRYVVDRRVRQGFTVYQSEPIGAPFNLRDGRVDAMDIAGFRQADRYYRYIADAGLVHANAEFFFSSELKKTLADDAAALERLARYWVARFGAFPVMWTLAQEIDNDFYYENNRNAFYDFSDNPWVRIAEYLHRHDGYGHPLSGHQETAYATTVTGFGTNADRSKISGGGVSIFLSDHVSARTGHDWWAAQFSPSLVRRSALYVEKDYWGSPKPAVCYEGRYCNLWTKDFGARAQGWIVFLSGFCGYGYGAADLWYYRCPHYLGKEDRDEVDVISVEDKKVPWFRSVEFESARQMIHLRRFLERFDWWNLAPVFDSSFKADCAAWVCARTPERRVFYFFDRDGKTGTQTGLAAGEYVARWYDPRTGTWGADAALGPVSGSLALPKRPSACDWVLELKTVTSSEAR